MKEEGESSLSLGQQERVTGEGGDRRGETGEGRQERGDRREGKPQRVTFLSI